LHQLLDEMKANHPGDGKLGCVALGLATEIAKIYALSVIIKTDDQLARARMTLCDRIGDLSEQLNKEIAVRSLSSE
jgi:hypothetical protein